MSEETMEKLMQTFQSQHTRAAILLHTGGKDTAPIKEQEMACRSYCQQQRYQLSEQDIYPDEGQTLCSDAPQLVRLRLLVVQGHLDVPVLAADFPRTLPWRGRAHRGDLRPPAAADAPPTEQHCTTTS